ncbi:MAG: N-acetylneuraminate synthase family protein [Lachnospiraceae bacterium]|nr:N-acetylneuraminate synthase family protein [Lachnospiraceae bacterium]
MKPLFIFEMANNHQGIVEHGKRIIREIKAICDKYPQFDYGFKFQYRNLDTFIHPDYQDRMDIKNVKRFKDTKLTQEQFAELLECLKENGFQSICTPFDEISVDNIVTQGYDYIKIASCSFTDWPLLEKIASVNKPVIASCAGSKEVEVKAVVDFFRNRNINFSLMHCVAEYPTVNEHLQLNQVDYLKKSFPDIRIGFSTHEDPSNTIPVRIAVAKGAAIFERHVGVPTEEITLNGYSSNPSQIDAWLAAAAEAYDICGCCNGRYESHEKEQADLAALKRGIFVKKDLKKGHVLKSDDYFLAFPCSEGQLVASDLSKYNSIVCQKDVKVNEPIYKENVSITNTYKGIVEVVKDINNLLREANVVVPAGSSCEISHHYGVEKYRQVGVAMIDCVNREYCKKILIVLPGQNHPNHYHVKKEETFVILHGTLSLNLAGDIKMLKKGDVVTVERNVMHSFSSSTGCIFEEISTTHYINDSFYENEEGFTNPRKTKVHFTEEMLSFINSEK